MLTIDDVNSIIERYGDIGFWYTLDLTKCSQTVDSITNYDFMEIKMKIVEQELHLLEILLQVKKHYLVNI